VWNHLPVEAWLVIAGAVGWSLHYVSMRVQLARYGLWGFYAERSLGGHATRHVRNVIVNRTSQGR
jgi:hypothetical protein